MTRKGQTARTLVRPVVSLCVLLLVSVPLSSTMSDPVAVTCGPLCHDFVEMEVQCTAMRDCFKYADDSMTNFWDCLEPCSDLGAPCHQLCRKEYDNLWKTCSALCVDEEVVCLFDCFDDTFMELKNRTLTLPSPDIGAFNPNTTSNHSITDLLR